MKKLLLTLALLVPNAAIATTRIEITVQDSDSKILSKPTLVVNEGDTAVLTVGSEDDDATTNVKYKFTVNKENEENVAIQAEVAFTEVIIETKETEVETVLSQDIEAHYGEQLSATLPNTSITINITAFKDTRVQEVEKSDAQFVECTAN